MTLGASSSLQRMDYVYKLEICLLETEAVKAIPCYHYYAWRRVPQPSHQNAVVVPA